MRRLLVLPVLTLASSMASGAVFYEGFNYTPPATLDGQTAPNGKVWAIAGPSAPVVNVVSGNLTAPTGLPAATGNMVQFGNNGGTNSGAVDRVDIGSYSSGTVYWSMLFRVDDVTGAVTGTTGAFVAGFNNTAGAQSTTPNVVAGRLVIRKDSVDGTKYNFGTSVNANTAAIQAWETTQRSAGEVHFLVGSYTFGPDANDDTARLWIDPDPNSFGTGNVPPENLSSTGADITGNLIRTFILRQNASDPAQMSADELRVDTTWAGVTSDLVPEPASVTLAGLAGVSLLSTRSRRRSRR